ncbi:unnamed protein product [Calypogeia fissa]
MIQAGMWQGDVREGISGALKNPGWAYFLQLAANCVKQVNAQRDKKYGISYARKAMIRCGLALDVDGIWKVDQLTPQLKDIIKAYPQNFAGYRDGLPALENGSMVDPDSEVASTSLPASIDPPTATMEVPAAAEIIQGDENEDLSESEHMAGPENGSDIFQDAQMPKSVDPDALEMVLQQSNAELWGFLKEYTSQQ